MSNLVFNERTKMIATHLNNLAVASIVTGVIVPAIQGVHISNDWKSLFSFVVVGFVLQLVFMSCSFFVLGTLKE